MTPRPVPTDPGRAIAARPQERERFAAPRMSFCIQALSPNAWNAFGALDLIATLGGGTVESVPEDVEGRRVPDAFLHNSRLSMFERQGFQRLARLGKHRWWVSRMISARAG